MYNYKTMGKEGNELYLIFKQYSLLYKHLSKPGTTIKNREKKEMNIAHFQTILTTDV